MADIATIARPYAEALFASAKPADLSAWANQLEDLAALFENAELIALANNPKLSSNELFKFIEGLLQSKPDQGLASFLNLLANNHRLVALPEIAKQFIAMKNQSEGAAEAIITSAFPMEGGALTELLASLKKRFGGKELRPTVVVDPELIGGVRVQVGDEVLDSSIKTRLVQMQINLSA
jgi:F-type H+-transporting ATPase subunit delta